MQEDVDVHEVETATLTAGLTSALTGSNSGQLGNGVPDRILTEQQDRLPRVHVILLHQRCTYVRRAFFNLRPIETLFGYSVCVTGQVVSWMIVYW